MEGSIEQKQQKKIFELMSSLGKLSVEVNRFANYSFLIVTYSNALQIDGCLQVAYPTPYSAQPSVLHLGSEESENDYIAKSLGKHLKTPVVLSINVEVKNKQEEKDLLEILLKTV